MQTIELNSVTPAIAAQSLLRLQGEPYTLKDYLMFNDIFNTSARKRLMMAGRQVSKSVTLAADMVTKTAVTPYLPLIYANTSRNQAVSFSTSKLDHFLIHSPIIYHSLMKSKFVINNVYNKRFDNFAEIRLSYFSESADRIRGNTGFELYLDEVQDMLYDAMIDAEQCLSAAEDPKITYAGTAKTADGTLEYLWSMSNQKEWIIRCPSCSKYNVPSIENIKPKGLSCKKCDAILNTYEGHWHAFADGKIDGYHIPQIIMPMHCNNPNKWKIIIDNLREYPEYKFLNEIMGISVGENESPITEQMLRDMCIPEMVMEERATPNNAKNATFMVAGIDWGGNGTAGVSRTTLSIYAVHAAQPAYIKVYGKIYSAGEPSAHVEDIAYRLNQFNVTMCYGDHGGGNFAMSQLSRYVPHIRIIPVMYTEQGAPYTWHDQGQRFSVNRTTMIDAFFMDVKFGHVRAMRWEDFAPFAKDILNIRVTTVGDADRRARRMWVHHPSKPDDSLHSMVFGWFAARVAIGRLDFFGDNLG